MCCARRASHTCQLDSGCCGLGTSLPSCALTLSVPMVPQVDPEEMKAMLEEQKQEKANKAAAQERLAAAAAPAQQKALPQGPQQRSRNRR